MVGVKEGGCGFRLKVQCFFTSRNPL